MGKLTLDADDLVPGLVQALQHPVVIAALRAVVAPQAQAAPSYMTVKEYAAHQRVCVRTVQGWCRRGLPSHQAGRLLRIDVQKADQWLEAGGAAERIHQRATRDAARAMLRRTG
jgi:hypothetical protein